MIKLIAVKKFSQTLAYNYMLTAKKIQIAPAYAISGSFYRVHGRLCGTRDTRNHLASAYPLKMKPKNLLP